MRGYIIKISDYREIFICIECEYCQLDSAGNHAWDCSYHENYPHNPPGTIFINEDENYLFSIC